MAISLTHSFVSTKSDGHDTSLVQPSNWNAQHTLTLATNRLIGRTTAGAGAAEEIVVGNGLSLATGALTLSNTPSITNITLGGAAAILLRNSPDRSGLLEVTQGGGATYTGFQATHGGTQFWSLLGNATAWGLYDDTNAKWIIRGTENAETIIFHNGDERITTTGGGIDVVGGVTTTTGITVGTTATADKLRLLATDDITLGGSAHAFQIGDNSTVNMSIDRNEITARNAGAASNLFLNPNGADVVCGDDTSVLRTLGKMLAGTTDETLGTANAAASGGMRASNAGLIAAAYDGRVAAFNRMGTDGTIVNFNAQGNIEGNISVAGTTVSLTGGHLARWSRLVPGDTSELLKGTVMSNLDAMVTWTGEANEQLNHTKISDVEGDDNVAGVFVAADNDDVHGDFYLAMTGDMVIRIGFGTVVQRGDLLMSAGDGTAKPQGDDIVRSKTIAKVISTSVSHTYPDGSYCVPCVLMAC